MAADKVAEFELKDDTVSSSKSKGKKECVFFRLYSGFNVVAFQFSVRLMVSLCSPIKH